MNIRPINENEFLEVQKLCSICFEYPFNTNGKGEEAYIASLKDEPPSKALSTVSETIGAFTEDNRLMSALCLEPFSFYFDGTALPGTGIGNVVTYPQHRRKGAVREIFQYLLPKLYREGKVFSYLYPFSEAFYNKFGYSRLHNSNCWNLDLSMVPDVKYEGTFHLYGDGANKEDFSSVYETFAAKLNMMVKRDSLDWDNLKGARGPYNNNYAYLYKDKNGVPRGYLIFKRVVLQGTVTLNVRELVYDGFTALKALMSFARTYVSDFRNIRFHAPAAYNLEYFCRDFSVGQSTVTAAKNGMVRVINVEEALKHAAYRSSGEFTISVLDAQIEENNRVFQVAFQNGKAVSVVPTASGRPDIKMPVDIFSAAITGSFDSADFDWQDGIAYTCGKDLLDSVFYKKPGWINNYF